MRSGLTFFWACAVPLALSAVSAAQDRVTTDDYARAARFMPSATAPLVLHTVDSPTWLPDGRLWYRSTVEEGAVLIFVDPGSRTARRLFEPSQLSRVLSSRMGGLGGRDAPTQMALSQDGRTFTLTAGEKRWTCDVPLSDCTPASSERGRGNPPEVLSP